MKSIGLETSTKALSTAVFAPDNVGFINTWKDSFTYFAGSNAGAAKSFGMTSQELFALLERYNANIQREYSGNLPKPILAKLLKLMSDCSDIIRDARNEYDSGKIQQLLGDFGHIPLILSAISGAADYDRAATNLSRADLDWYFRFIFGSQAQAQEYLVKQQLMRLIGQFREALVNERYSISNSDPAFYCYNNLIIQLDRDIIQANQKTMPDSETFDRCETFKDKVHSLTCEIPDAPDYKDLRNGLILALNIAQGQACPSQENLSVAIITCVKQFLRSLGIREDVEEIEISPDAYEKLKFVLPLIEYITSAHNPFARNGVLGEMITSPFHLEALEAYRKHESSIFVHKIYQLESRPFSGMRFTEEQFNDLIFGNEEYEAQRAKYAGSFASRFGGAIGGLLTQGDANVRRNNDLDRRKATQRAVPAEYLMLEAPKPKGELGKKK